MIDRESLVLCSYYLDNPALRRFHAIIRPEQFQEPGTSMLFTVLQKYHQEYGRMPTYQEAEMEVRDYRGPNSTRKTLPSNYWDATRPSVQSPLPSRVGWNGRQAGLSTRPRLQPLCWASSRNLKV